VADHPVPERAVQFRERTVVHDGLGQHDRGQPQHDHGEQLRDGLP
jgi:hypothetical protein